MGRFPSPPRGSMPGQQPPWERRGTDEPRGPDREVGVRLPSVGSFGRSAARRAAGRRRLRSESLLSSRCLGDGEPREGGSSRECVPPPLHPSRGTALKSCGVCHRPAPARMRIGQLEVFSFLFTPFPLSFQPPLVLQLLKKSLFSPSETGEREGARQAAGQEGRGRVGGRGPCAGPVRPRGAGPCGRRCSAQAPPPPPGVPARRARCPASCSRRRRRPPSPAPIEEVPGPGRRSCTAAAEPSPRPHQAPRPRCPRSPRPAPGKGGEGGGRTRREEGGGGEAGASVSPAALAPRSAAPPRGGTFGDFCPTLAPFFAEP